MSPRRLAAGVVLVCAFAACSSQRTVRVVDTTLGTDARTLQLALGACPEGAVAVAVEQDDQQVILGASAWGPNVGDCAAGAEVVLDTPLGGRRVLDGAEATTSPTGSPAYVRPAETELVEGLVDFARHPQRLAPPAALGTGRVALGLGERLLVTRDAAELADPSAWRLDAGRESFRDLRGPFSALERIAENGGRQMVAGPHRRCVSPPTPPPAAVADLRRISAQPATVTSCREWWSVDLYLEDDGTVRAVTLDLWEP